MSQRETATVAKGEREEAEMRWTHRIDAIKSAQPPRWPRLDARAEQQQLGAQEVAVHAEAGRVADEAGDLRTAIGKSASPALEGSRRRTAQPCPLDTS